MGYFVLLILTFAGGMVAGWALKCDEIEREEYREKQRKYGYKHYK